MTLAACLARNLGSHISRVCTRLTVWNRGFRAGSGLILPCFGPAFGTTKAAIYPVFNNMAALGGQNKLSFNFALSCVHLRPDLADEPSLRIWSLTHAFRLPPRATFLRLACYHMFPALSRAKLPPSEPLGSGALDKARKRRPGSRTFLEFPQTVLAGAAGILGSGLPWPGPWSFWHGFLRRAKWR